MIFYFFLFSKSRFSLLCPSPLSQAGLCWVFVLFSFFPLLSAVLLFLSLCCSFTGLNASTSPDASSNNGLSKQTKVMHAVWRWSGTAGTKHHDYLTPMSRVAFGPLTPICIAWAAVLIGCCLANIKQVKTCPRTRQLQYGKIIRFFFSLSLSFRSHSHNTEKKNALILPVGMNRRLGSGFRETERWFWSGFHWNLESVLALICWAPLGSSRCGQRKKKEPAAAIPPQRTAPKKTRRATRARGRKVTCSVMLPCSVPSLCNLMRCSAGGQRHWQRETLRSGIIMGAAGFFFLFFEHKSVLFGD